MKEIELKNRVIKWLSKMNTTVMSRPHEFTAQEVATAVEGYAGSVGRVAKDVINELNARGISVEYRNNLTPRRFILT